MPTKPEIFTWEEEGYEPLVFDAGWQVALLNWEPPIDGGNIGEIERHNRTDEVFVLLRGRALLFTRAEGQELGAVEMEPGKIYNVPRGVWHNLVATKDVQILIVERRGTHVDDTEIRSMSDTERKALGARLPSWVESDSKPLR